MNPQLDSLVWLCKQYSRERPIRGRALAAAVGLSSVRELQRLVREAREVHRLPIGASCAGGRLGYYYAASDRDKAINLNQLRRRALSTLAAMRAFRSSEKQEAML